MIGLRFAKLIEHHSKSLADELVQRLHSSERTSAFRNISTYELREDIQELYQHLSDWLATKTEVDVRRREFKLGHYRAQQHIPVEQFLWALILSKEVVYEFLEREAVAQGPLELISELDFLRMLNAFFDRAMYHAICGWVEPLKAQQGEIRKGVLGLPT